jgi:NAD(P)H-dependent flavin oxidoreductase YrpB (nitropropane dioxygenase family)
MSLPALLEQCLRLPVVVAPMFLISNPQLVLACCRNGLVGSFPALNQREQRLQELAGRDRSRARFAGQSRAVRCEPHRP